MAFLLAERESGECFFVKSPCFTVISEKNVSKKFKKTP